MEYVNFLIPKCRWYLVLYCLCLFTQQPGIIMLTGFSGLFVFILKLCRFYLSCGSCRTLRSPRNIFQLIAFSLLSFNRPRQCLWLLRPFCQLVFPSRLVVNSEIQLSDCWTIHSTLCFCPWSCKVLELCTLGSAGLLGF